MSNQVYTIYALVDPRDNTIRYVGMTVDPESRLRDHASGISNNDIKDKWINDLKKVNLKPIMKILEDKVKETQATDRELHWIKTYLDAGASLTNIKHVSPQGISAQPVDGWVNMLQATRQLKQEGYKIASGKIGRLAQRGKIKSKADPLNDRVRLVNLDELRIIFAPRRINTDQE